MCSQQSRPGSKVPNLAGQQALACLASNLPPPLHKLSKIFKPSLFFPLTAVWREKVGHEWSKEIDEKKFK